MSTMNGETEGGRRIRSFVGERRNANNNDDHSTTTTTTSSNNEFVVKVSCRFITLILVASVLLSFAVGRVAHVMIVSQQVALQQQQQQLSEMIPVEVINPDTDGAYTARKPRGSGSSSSPNKQNNMALLPDPVMTSGKQPPTTAYTSKTFDTRISASLQSRWIVTDAGKQHEHEQQQQQQKQQQDKEVDQEEHEKDHHHTTNDNDHNDNDDEFQGRMSQHKHHFEDNATYEQENDIHLPAGQHLLIDIEHVDSNFLNDEERLAIAMLDLVAECGLTLLSYHCHKLYPTGVSCAGVLLESHVSFHTWPQHGVITLDLYTCGPKSLIPVVPTAERLFAIPNPSLLAIDNDDIHYQPNMVWAHKYRGFYDNTTRDDIADLIDLQAFPLGQMTDYKKEIATIETDFQHIYIVDVLRPGKQSLYDYHQSLVTTTTDPADVVSDANIGSDDDSSLLSYQARNPTFFQPDRIIFLDGVLQSRRSGDAAYHESLVHPGMFAHPNPKRVAIIGGGEGATLREVLKHNTVETVFMIEIDELMVNVSRQYIPEWSDCSNVEGSTPSCFDDPRVQLYHMDAFQWFIDSFPVDGTEPTEQAFDVIIMDALDPQVEKDFVDALYDGGPFLKSLPVALTEKGVLTAQVGEAPSLNDTPEYTSTHKNRVKFVNSLVDLGFQSIVEYDEGGHSGFEFPWKIMVAFKDFDTRTNWFASEALINLKIRQRTLPSIDGNVLLKYFDGPLMQSYQYPNVVSAVVFCRGNPHLKECQDGHGFDPERDNIPISSLEIRQSSLGETAGRGIFAKEDIPHMSYVGLERLVPNIYISPQTYKLMVYGVNHGNQPEWIYYDWYGDTIEAYVVGYGHLMSSHGGIEAYLDSTFHCFINHACDGNNNVGHNLSISETSADPKVIPPEILDPYYGRDRIYNPAAERQVHFYSSGIPLRDIKKGEEVFDNYIPMSGASPSYWEDNILRLKGMCQDGFADRVFLYDEKGKAEKTKRTEISST